MSKQFLCDSRNKETPNLKRNSGGGYCSNSNRWQEVKTLKAFEMTKDMQIRKGFDHKKSLNACMHNREVLMRR